MIPETHTKVCTRSYAHKPHMYLKTAWSGDKRITYVTKCGGKS